MKKVNIYVDFCVLLYFSYCATKQLENMKQTMILITALVMIVACKKSSDKPSSDDKPSYIGKWPHAYNVDWHMWVGVLQKDTFPAHTGEYIEFKTDGTLTECIYAGGDLNYSTFNYQVINGILHCDDFPDSSRLIVSGNNLTIDASEPSNQQSLWWHYKK